MRNSYNNIKYNGSEQIHSVTEPILIETIAYFETIRISIFIVKA